MIPFDQIDAHLEAIHKNRAWLAQVTGRSPGSIRAALAPNAVPKQRSSLLQKALTDAIRTEELRQKQPTQNHEMQNLVLRPTPEEYKSWSKAALEDKKTLNDWAVDSLNNLAHELRGKIPALPSLESITPSVVKSKRAK